MNENEEAYYSGKSHYPRCIVFRGDNQDVELRWVSPNIARFSSLDNTRQCWIGGNHKAMVGANYRGFGLLNSQYATSGSAVLHTLIEIKRRISRKVVPSSPKDR